MTAETNVSNAQNDPRPGAEPGWPPVSVLVITKGRHEQAERAVRLLLGTDYPAGARQIVVLEETDAPRAIAGAGVTYHTIPMRGLGFGFARNRALDLAAHSIAAFVDDDCAVERDWLKQLVRPLLENADAAAVGGAVLVPPCGPVGQCENILGFPGGGLKYVHAAGGRLIRRATFSTCNAAVRRDLPGVAVRFDEDLALGGEDDLLSRRLAAGHAILFNPAAVVRHAPRDSLAAVFRWFVRRGRARVSMLKHLDRRGREVARMLLTSTLLRALIAVAAARLAGIPVPAALGAVLAVYYGAVLWRLRWARAYYPAPRTLLLLPVVKACMDVGMDIGEVLGWLAPAGRPKRGTDGG